MIILPWLVDFLASIERFEPRPYPDPDEDHLAIGFGHSSSAGPPEVKWGMEITLEQAHVILHDDIERFAKEISHYIKTPLTDEKFNACVSLAYNMGGPDFSRTEVCRLINDPTIKNHLIKAGNAFTNDEYCMATDRITKERRFFDGLKARRIKEACFFHHDWPPAQ